MTEFADQEIGFMGIVSLCEALRVNTKITRLDLYSAFLVFVSIILHPLITLLPDDTIGVDGAVALSEMLKTNTALVTIVLESLKAICLFTMKLH